MNLLVFAHRGEAQAFIEQDHYTPFAFLFNGLFFSESKNSFLLITGEGSKEASEKSVAVLAVHGEKIKHVYNIGIAGSLSPKLKRNDIVWVRSSYAHNSEKMEFKSFTTTHHTKIDCLTTFHRVTTLEEKETLNAFADIVDRELWSILSACHLFKLEGFALKIISDDLADQNFCETVKSSAKTFSELLYNEWCLYNKNKHSVQPHLKPYVKKEDYLNFLFDDLNFHFTLTQKRQAQGLWRSLKLKGLFSEEDFEAHIHNFKAQHTPFGSAKDLTRKLLASLDELNNPLKFKIKSKIKDALTPLTDIGAVVNTDPDLESSHVQITMAIHSTRDQKKLQLALEQFQYQKIKDIFSGKLDDDV